MRITTKSAGLFAICLLLRPAAHASDPWTPPTVEELTMTSVPQVPGAGAIYLYREEKYQQAQIETYIRIKVLSESGKDYATVELPLGGVEDVHYDNIAGRTIHKDGTIIPFSGKPYEKLIEKEKGHKYKVKVFSLPSVEIGSIIEYRYKITSSYYGAPDWYLQSDLFTRKAFFSWAPEGGTPIAWTPILPSGLKVTIDTRGGGMHYVLNAADIQPRPHDEMMPPLDSVSYRVLFYYTHYKDAVEFWTEMGALWTKSVNKYVGPGSGVRAAVTSLVAPGDTDAHRLHPPADRARSQGAGRQGSQQHRRRARAQTRQQRRAHHALRRHGARRGLQGLYHAGRRPLRTPLPPGLPQHPAGR
jgi:hypothetical protein